MSSEQRIINSLMSDVNTDVQAAFASAKGDPSLEVEGNNDCLSIYVQKGEFVYSGDVLQSDDAYDDLVDYRGDNQ